MLLLGATLLGLAHVGPPRPAAAPITMHYRIETKTEQTVDLSGFGQPNQVVNLGIVSWISVTLNDTTGGRVLHVVADSLKYDGGVPQLTQASVDSARGGTIHAFIDGKGHLQNIVTRPEENAFLADVQGVIHSFFPKVRAGVQAGDSWIDTVEVKNNQNGSKITSKFTISYTAGERSAISGVQALKLNSKSSATMSGTAQNPMGGTMEVEGTIAGSSESFIGADGRYLGGSASSTANQVFKVSMAPSPIPVKTLRTVSVNMIP